MGTKKKTAGDPRVVREAVSALGDQPTKATVRKAVGKESDGAPIAGRLDKDGKIKERPQITIAQPKYGALRMFVMGEPGSSLILHRWGRKAITEMLGKHMGHKLPQEDKQPFEDFLDTLYRDAITGEMTIRSIMFKAAMLAALRDAPGVTRIDAITGITVMGEFFPLYGKPTNRLDAVRVGPYNDRVADIRFRGEYDEWVAALTFRFNTAAISETAIANLLSMAGALYGIGEWRVQKSGQNGLFRVIDKDVAEAEMERLGRWKIDQLTPDNTYTTAILREYHLDAETLAKLASKPRSDTNGASVGIAP